MSQVHKQATRSRYLYISLFDDTKLRRKEARKEREKL